MKGKIAWLALAACLVLGSAIAAAAPSVSLNTFEMELTTEEPITHDAVADDWEMQGRVKLDLRGELSDSITGKFIVNLYNSQGYNTSTTDESDEGLETVIDEANLTLMEPMDLPIDVKIGRQYINVGRGDGVTTFNLFYPQSMRYATDLSEYRPVDAVRVDWYTDSVTVTAIAQTKFTPVYYSDTIEALYNEQKVKMLPQMLQLLSQKTGTTVNPGGMDLETPELGGDTELGVGLKVSGNLAGYDVDLHYQHGYTAMPTLKDVQVSGEASDLQANLTLGYLPMDKIGVSWAGPLGDAGLWGELAYNKPDEDFYSDEILALGGYLPESLRPSDKEYVTGIIGIDYFFENGAYGNIQYVHGLPQEFTEPMVKDYLTMDAYQTYKSDMLKIEGRILYCLNDGSYALSPEITYKVNDDVTLSAKAIKFFGDEGQDEAFAAMKPLSEVRLGVTLTI